ncbi:hypothetical protein ACO0LO_18380 [Undibacterium sp. TJN25]|uniref:hypothetical protein n=1 Tax=Undibacterium sp. TJN25 TaxID=3413056 RepID=UPI003BF37D9C
MKFTYIFLLIGSLHFSGWAAPSEFPKDLAVFLAERESCDHWRGEPGYDDERQADINWSVYRTCSGTDSKLADLKKKYRGKANILVHQKVCKTSNLQMMHGPARNCSSSP